MLTLQHRLGGYREYAAPAALAAWCENVWLYKTAEVATQAVHRVLPDPALNIQFSYRRDRWGDVHDARLLVSAGNLTPVVAGFEPGREIVALKVKLEWMEAVAGLDANEMRERTIDLDDIEPGLAPALLDELSEARAIEAVTAAFIARVGGHVTRRLRATPTVAGRAMDLVRRAHGAANVGGIADRIGVSPRYLRRVVDRDAGISLKAYARTVRLLHAITTADAQPDDGVSWAAVAAGAGYYDQAHLIRECQALCGLTPVEVLRERRTETDGVLVTWDQTGTGSPTPRSSR